MSELSVVSIYKSVIYLMRFQNLDKCPEFFELIFKAGLLIASNVSIILLR